MVVVFGVLYTRLARFNVVEIDLGDYREFIFDCYYEFKRRRRGVFEGG